MKTIIKRHSAGCYTLTRGDYTVEVWQCLEWQGPDKWQARAEWDRHLYTDPLPTYRDAKLAALLMLDDSRRQAAYDAANARWPLLFVRG